MNKFPIDLFATVQPRRSAEDYNAAHFRFLAYMKRMENPEADEAVEAEIKLYEVEADYEEALGQYKSKLYSLDEEKRGEVMQQMTRVLQEITQQLSAP